MCGYNEGEERNQGRSHLDNCNVMKASEIRCNSSYTVHFNKVVDVITEVKD